MKGLEEFEIDITQYTIYKYIPKEYYKSTTPPQG